MPGGGERTLHFPGKGIQSVDSGRDVGRPRCQQLARATDCVEERCGGHCSNPVLGLETRRVEDDTRCAAAPCGIVIASALRVPEGLKLPPPRPSRSWGSFFLFNNCPNSPHAGRTCFFLCNFEFSDFTRMRYMRAAAKFFTPCGFNVRAHKIHIHRIRIFFFEEI